MSEYTRSDEIREANRRLRDVMDQMADRLIDAVDRMPYEPDDPFAGFDDDPVDGTDLVGWQ